MTSEPGPTAAQGRYLSAMVVGDLVYVAGMTPRVDGVVAYRGRVVEDVALEDAVAAATLSAERGLAAARAVTPAGFRLGGVAKAVVYVQASPGFEQHSQVADGASAVLAARFGEDAVGTRAAVGVSSLPGDSVVEVELILWLFSALLTEAVHSRLGGVTERGQVGSPQPAHRFPDNWSLVLQQLRNLCRERRVLAQARPGAHGSVRRTYSRSDTLHTVGRIRYSDRRASKGGSANERV